MIWLAMQQEPILVYDCPNYYPQLKGSNGLQQNISSSTGQPWVLMPSRLEVVLRPLAVHHTLL